GDRANRRTAVAVTGNRPQLPVQRDQQGRRAQPHRRHPYRSRRRLALTTHAHAHPPRRQLASQTTLRDLAPLPDTLLTDLLDTRRQDPHTLALRLAWGFRG